MKLPELKSILMHNNLKKGNTQLNKPDIVKLLVANNIITSDNLENKKQTSLDVHAVDKPKPNEERRKEYLRKYQKEYHKKYMKEYKKEYQKRYWEEYRQERKQFDNDSLCGNVDNLYDRLKHIRNSPRQVEVVDQVTGDVITYPSIYKAGKAYGKSAKLIYDYNGRIMSNRYEIKIY